MEELSSNISDSGIDISALRADLGNALRRLEGALHTLDERLGAERDYPLWVFGYDEPHAARQAAREILRAVHYLPDQHGQHTRSLPALVGTGADTLAAARAVNAAKAEVMAALAAMRGVKVAVIDPETQRAHNRALAKDALTRLGHGHLHAKQTERQIVIPECPQVRSVSFYWAATPQTYRRSVPEVRQRLEALMERVGELRHLVRDRDRLDALAEDEPLAEVRPTRHVPRANVVCQGHGEDRLETVRAVQPLLYLAGPGQGLPYLVPLPAVQPLSDAPGAAGGQGRWRRADARIELEPYLPSLRIHRYMDPEAARRPRRRENRRRR